MISFKGKRTFLADVFFHSKAYRAFRCFERQSLVIFNYHRVRSSISMQSEFDDNVYGPDQEVLRKHFIWLKQNADVISENQLLDHLRGRIKLPRSCVMVTFDDGYRDNYELALPVIQEQKMPASFFIPTKAIEDREIGWWDSIAYLLKKTPMKEIEVRGNSFNLSRGRLNAMSTLHYWMRTKKASETESLVSEIALACRVPLPEKELCSNHLMTWDQVRAAAQAGVTIGSHTHSHRVLSTLNLSEQLQELQVSKEILERQLGRKVHSIAYPVGGTIDYNAETGELAEAAGYEMAYSFHTGANRLDRLNRFEIGRISAEDTLPLTCAATAMPSVFARSRFAKPPRRATEEASTERAPLPKSESKSGDRSHWPVSILSTLASLVGMLMPLVLVRLLEPAVLGSFKIFFLYLMVLPPLTFISGVSSGLSYWAGRGEMGKRAIQASSVLFLVLSLFSLLFLSVFKAPIASELNLSVEWVGLFAVALSLGIAGMFYDEASVATGRIWTGALFYSGFEVLRTGVIVLAAVLTHDVLWIIRAHIVMQGLKVLTGYTLAYRQELFRFQWDWSILRAVGQYAFPVSLAFVFGLFLNYSDQIILSRMISAPEFALYSVCCLTLAPLLVLETSLTRVLIPQLSQAFTDGKLERVAALFRKAVTELAFFMVPAAIGLIVFAEPIIQILFTKAYLPGAHFLRLYALWYLTLLLPQDAIARANGKARWILGNFVAFSTLTVALCGTLAYFFGASGALAGLLIARFSSRVYTVLYMKRVLGMRVKEFVPLASLSKIVVVCAVLGMGCLLFESHFSSPLAWFFFCGVSFTVAYFVLAFLWIADPAPLEDRKVLMLTPGLSIGGLERMILNLSKSLKRTSQWKPHVLAYDFDPHSSLEPNLVQSFQGLEIPVNVEMKPPRFSFKTVLNIARQAKKNGITVIHTHDLGALIYGVLAKFLLLGRIRLVHTQHSFVHLGRSWKYRYYEKFFTAFADSLAVVSEDTRRSYLDLGISTEKMHVIANGVDFPNDADLDRASRVTRRTALIKAHGGAERLAELQAEFWILYLARVHGRKGQDHAVKLWSQLPPELRKRSALIFVGPETDPGEKGRLQALIEKAPDSKRVFLAGPSHHPQEWIRASDVFLSCSEFEGMPLAPVEALGSGVPAILSLIPGHEFLASYAKTYSLDSPIEGANAVTEVLNAVDQDDCSLRAQLWKRSESIRDAYTLSAMSRQYEKLYEAIP